MPDIFLESARALLLLGILCFFIRADKDIAHGRRGWLYIQIGFLLVLFGTVVDMSDSIAFMRGAFPVGNLSLQAFLREGVGYLGGTVFLAVGFMKWLPTMHYVDDLRGKLAESRRLFDYKVMERTMALEKEFDGRSKLEAALRQTEEHRQHLYENAPIGISHGLISGNLVERNAAYARMLGYESPSELEAAMEESGDVAFFWHDKNDFETMVERLKEENHISDYETRFDRKDGSVIWVRLSITVLADRNNVNYYFYCFVDDITEDKKAAEELARSEQWLKTIIDFLPAGVIMVDIADQHVAEINSTALGMLGYDREDIIDKHCCSHLCPREKGECPILDMGEEMLNREVSLRRKDRVEIPVLKTATHVTMRGREYLLEVFVDIAEQKRLEHLKEDVDHIVRHDLKSPVVSMINACSVLLMEDGLSEEMWSMLEFMKQQGNKVLRLAGMSLAIYKMEAGTYDYEPQKVDMAAVVQRVRDELAEKALNLGVAVRVDLDGEALVRKGFFETMGDDLLYESMVANLLSNAIEASPKGGTVTVSLVNGSPSKVVVANQGVVPEEIRDVFFNKFVTAGKKNGTGLGTYSAALSARTLGGSIDMETSDAENRTAVTVSLPPMSG